MIFIFVLTITVLKCNLKTVYIHISLIKKMSFFILIAAVFGLFCFNSYHQPVRYADNRLKSVRYCRSIYTYLIGTVGVGNADFPTLDANRVASAVFTDYFKAVIVVFVKLYCSYKLSITVYAGNGVVYRYTSYQ